MRKVDGREKTLQDLLQNTKYTIHYYQREYAWQRKQLQELIDDLTDEFLTFYDPEKGLEEVAYYGVYFMGSVVLAGRENAIIDGQQRLTSLSLLLMFLNLRLKKLGQTNDAVVQMLYSTSYGKTGFNLSVDDREECLAAIYTGESFDSTNCGESVVNLYNRYQDIEDLFPEEIDDEAIPFFAEWLIKRVYFIEIICETEQDAHKVFVSMNDRGLSLTSAEMLKGYLLSEVADDKKREKLNDAWKDKMLILKEMGKGEEESCIKDWLRAKYAETIRETKKNAEPLDFDLIGTTFHKWVREKSSTLGLAASEDFERFIEELCKFVDVYVRVKKCEEGFDAKQPYLYYNAALGFTLQTQLVFAPIKRDDMTDVIEKKVRIVSRFVDILIYTRAINFKKLEYSTIKNYVFGLTKRVRDLEVDELVVQLGKELELLGLTIEGAWPKFRLNFFTKKYIKHMLARITDYIERGCDNPGHYLDYVAQKTKRPFEVEHIITDHFEWYTEEYGSREAFDDYRARIGNLALLDKSTNSSINDDKYVDKLPVYESTKGNALTAALGKQAYEHNPRFKKFIAEHEPDHFDFKSYDTFGMDQIDERGELLGNIVSVIWEPDFEELAKSYVE